MKGRNRRPMLTKEGPMRRTTQVLAAGAAAATGVIAAMTVAFADVPPVGYSYYVNPNASDPQQIFCVSAGTVVDGHYISTEVGPGRVSVQPGVDPYNFNSEPYYGPGGYCAWAASQPEPPPVDSGGGGMTPA